MRRVPVVRRSRRLRSNRMHRCAALVRSPDRSLHVALRVDGDGRPEYSIRRKDRTIVDWSRLGFILADQPKLERNFELVDVAQRSFDDTWEQPWGERRYVRNHGNEMRATLREKSGRELIVVFRVFDDGVGFRYEFPKQAALTRGGHRRGADGVCDRGAGHRLVDPWRRMESLRVPLQQDAACRSWTGPHAVDLEARQRRTRGDPRSGAGRLCRHVVAAGDGPATQGGSCRRRRRDPRCAARRHS